MKMPFIEYWKILDVFEDYLTTGYKREHPEPLNPEALETDSLEKIIREINSCTGCGLCRERQNPVPGMGVMNPLVMVIGEGPGAEEDRTGIPFVGRAGKYLDKWFDSIGLSRKTNCFIGNIIKCRPPGNRDPLPEESAACIPYLQRQVDILKPKTILALGRISSQILIGTSEGIGKLRGGTYEYRGIPLIPTYHPSGVLRNPHFRASVWEDLKRLKKLLEEIQNK